MTLLTAQEISALFESSQLQVPSEYKVDPSAFQPSSLDLHLGRIYLPGREPNQLGGESRPAGKHRLRTGQTVILTPIECLKLKNEIAGIVFPPSSFAVKGLLMTNAGHIDPGYE